MILSHRLWGQPNASHRWLFLHGMGGTGSLWRPIAAMLEDSDAILAVDQRGHGGSQVITEGGFSPLDFARDVQETQSALGFSPAWVVGHSMGVRTACALAHLSRKSVSGLVLVDLGPSGLAGGGLGDALASFIGALDLTYSSRNELRDALISKAPDRSLAQYLVAVSIPLEGGRYGFPFDRNALMKTIREAQGVSILPWIKEALEAGIRILWLRGETSSVWRAEDFENTQKELAKYPHLVMETVSGTGHGLPFEKRKEFVERIKQFCAD